MKSKLLISFLLILTTILSAQNEPVLRWKFDEAEGDFATDIYKGLKAEFKGPNWGEGLFNSGAVSNGYFDRINVPDNDILDLTTEGTVAIFFKINEFLPYAGLIHKGEKKNWKDEAYTFQFWDTGKRLRGAIFSEGKEEILDSDIDLETDKWYFGIFSWNESVLRIYLDGEMVAEKANTIGAVRVTDGGLQIASQLEQKYNNSLLYFGLDGTVDDVSIFNEFLDETEVTQLAQAYGLLPVNELGPQVHFNFNEGSGTTTQDLLHSVTGTLTGSVSWASGVIGSALLFDPTSNGHVTVDNNDFLNPETEITLEAWIKWTIDPATGSPWSNIINKNGEDQYQLQHSSDNSKFEFAVKTTEGRKWIQSVNGPLKDIWYHVAGTYNSSTGAMAIYVNGAKENTRSQSGDILTSNAKLMFGRHLSPGRYFTGVIDEVIIYNKALNDEEIKERYLTTRPEEDAPEVFAYFQLDEKGSSNIKDEKELITGNLTNSPEWVQGKKDYALQFNGQTQYIAFPGTENLPLTENLTLSAWVNASENKTSKILQKGDWDGHSLGMDVWKGWKTTVSIGSEAHDLEWGHGRPILGEWYHLVVTYNGSVINFYVNAELVASKEITGSLRINGRPLSVASDNGAQKFFKGMIDEMLVANSALPSEDIEGYYNSFFNVEKVWTEMEVTGFESFPYSFDINSQGHIFSGNWGGAGVFRSTDNGITWENLTSGYWVWTVEIDENDDIFVGTSSQGIIRSTDNGNTWESLTVSPASSDYRDLAIHDNNIYASSWGGGIFKSTDNGDSWTNISSTLSSNVIHSITFDSQGNLWAGAYDGLGVFKSSDDGVSWDSIPIPYGFIWSIDINELDEIYVGTYGGPEDDGLGLYISTDGGASWEKEEIFNGLNIFGVKFIDSQTFVMTWENGIYATENYQSDGVKNVEKWLSFNSGIRSGEVTAVISLPNGNLLLGTVDSKLYSSSGFVTSLKPESKSGEKPENHYLSQNFPNPFNPATTIRLSILRQGVYTLTVYNLLGQEVNQIFNGNLNPGEYSFNFDAGGLSSGVYLYALKGDGVNMVKKMQLLK